MNFTCNGNITGLLLGVDIRTVLAESNRTEYPEVQMWRGIQQGNFGLIYRRGSTSEIALTSSGSNSPDGVLQYNLTTPLSFQSGDRLGVYQPPDNNSVVRLFLSFKIFPMSISYQLFLVLPQQ